MSTLLSLTLSGSALTLLLLALRRILGRKLPSGVYYYAWLLVLLRFLLPLPGLIPVGSGAVSAEPEPLPAARPELAYEETGPVWYPAAAPVLQPLPQAAQAEPLPQTAAEEEAAEPSSPAPVRLSVDWRSPRLWLGLWGLGAAICVLWPASSYLRFTSALCRRSRDAGPELLRLYREIPGPRSRLLVCPGLRTPLSFGVLAPRIVLPEELTDPDTLCCVLRHETTHYRRRDPLYKWFAVLVLSLHWFNPLSWLIRRELDRACELSCDEALLRNMDREQKRAYGETLLRMAASSPLPAGVVATTFSTEKKKLKERLEQIMNYHKKKGRVLSALLALLLLCGCGAAAGPASGAREATLVPHTENAAEVSDVDGLLAAIAPGATILLAPGEYDLSTAADYGQETGSAYYRWVEIYSDGGSEPCYELQIADVDGLTLRGAGEGESTVSAVPRYANVVLFQNCRDLRLEQLTAGHTREPGFCAGGVLRFETCSRVAIEGCGLFGCGTIGVIAQNCTDLSVTDSRIYECSYGAVDLRGCRNVTVEGCAIERNGVKPGAGDAYCLFAASNSNSVCVSGCRIENNAAQMMLNSSYTQDFLFLSNTVQANRFPTCLFKMEQYPVTVDGCAFPETEAPIWIFGNGVFPTNAQGESLDAASLQAMSFLVMDPAAVKPASPAADALELAVGESVTVRTVDEFLAAIGPDRSIILDGELFDLSTASDYGSSGGEYYYWRENFDGPELIITGVSGLTIRAASEDPRDTTLSAVPRYANVLSFRDCEHITLIGFTAGHTKEPGSCSGGVLSFTGCHEISLEGCRLYGCGILGLHCESCTGILARDCEIFECSQGGVQMSRTDGVRLLNCDIHDVPSPALEFYDCGDRTWNGVPLVGDSFDLDAEGTPQPHTRNQDGSLAVLLYPLGLFDPGPYRDWMRDFAREVQDEIVRGDWEALSARISYPIQVRTRQQDYVFIGPEQFLAEDWDAIFSSEFREKVAEDPLEVCGICSFGNTFCDGHLAFARIRTTDVSPNGLLLTCISVDEALEDDREPVDLRVVYYGVEHREFTLSVGETVDLNAYLYPLGLFPDAEINWSCDNEEALKLTPGEKGATCRLEALQPVRGGVKVTVSWRSARQEITVYFRES